MIAFVKGSTYTLPQVQHAQNVSAIQIKSKEKIQALDVCTNELEGNMFLRYHVGNPSQSRWRRPAPCHLSLTHSRKTDKGSID